MFPVNIGNMKLSLNIRQHATGFLAFFLAAAAFSAADEGPWTTDAEKALQTAKAESKFVLMDFAGSDWCPPCKLLKASVFSKKEFLDFAKEKLVLVDVDFPQTHPLSPAQEKANAKLAEKYKAEVLPTVIVLNADGKQVFREEGYDGSAPDKYIEKLKKAMK
jgi:protein disulfide-isomerase